MGQTVDVGAAYIDEAHRSLRGHKRLAEGAMAQLSDEEFFRVIGDEDNSVAIIAKHIAGNIRSRFTDFFTSDGEKPDRHRDEEFEVGGGDDRATLMRRWEENWQVVLNLLQSLKPEDLLRTVTIRGEPHTVLMAVHRQVAHYAYHVGQIVFLAKHLRGKEWKTLSVPRGKSEEFNRKMSERTKTGNFPERP
jgi:uncharacterized damage-inducible protein DinB